MSSGISPESLFIPMALLFLLVIVWLKFMRLWFLMKDYESPRRVVAALPSVPSITVTMSPSSDPPPTYDNLQTSSGHQETPPPCYAEAVKKEEV